MADPVYHALIEACGKPGCPVCRLALQAVRLYLDNLLYENVNDYGVRSYLRRSLGFCNLHTWQLLETGHGNAMGIAMIYHDILSNVLKRLPEETSETQPGPGFFAWLRHARSQAAAQMEAVVRAIPKVSGEQDYGC